MEKSSKRGKIPQSDWPSIMARYEAGETLASIARTYDCSPPAISYILSRSRTRDTAAENNEPNVTEPLQSAPAKPCTSDLPAAKATEPGPGTEERAIPDPTARANEPINAS